jgi:hypothetical protein
MLKISAYIGDLLIAKSNIPEAVTRGIVIVLYVNDGILIKIGNRN